MQNDDGGGFNTAVSECHDCIQHSAFLIQHFTYLVFEYF